MKKPPRFSRQILAAVYCNNLLGLSNSVNALQEKISSGEDYLSKACKELEEQGFLKRVKQNYYLAEKGRKKIRVIFAGGVFDIIHPGHVHTLRESKKLGDVLVVSIARNSTVVKNKGHEPLNDEKLRQVLVQSLKSVDCAILGSKRNIFETVMKVDPDIIALGYDQKHDENVLAQEIARRGLKAKVVRLSSPIPNIKSSDIIKEQGIMREF